MAFKMNGSIYKKGGVATASVMKNKEGKANRTEEPKTKPEEKSLMETAYDKASQVGMGIKNVIKQGPGRSILLGDGSRQTTFDPVKAFNVGYQKEKEHDEGSTPAKYVDPDLVKKARADRKAARKKNRADRKSARHLRKSDEHFERYLNDGKTKAQVEKKEEKIQKRAERISGVTKANKQAAKAEKATKKKEYSNMTYDQKKAVGGSSYYKG